MTVKTRITLFNAGLIVVNDTYSCLLDLLFTHMNEGAWRYWQI